MEQVYTVADKSMAIIIRPSLVFCLTSLINVAVLISTNVEEEKKMKFWKTYLALPRAEHAIFYGPASYCLQEYYYGDMFINKDEI